MIFSAVICSILRSNLPTGKFAFQALVERSIHMIINVVVVVVDF